ncbi:hypothetical protein RB201_15770 [Streptomyces sp. S1A(2023)]
MDTQQNTALTRALAEVPGPLPTSGVIHIVIPHTDRFTVVGNHLAQHPGLSCTAIGIAVRIQSLPQGTEVSIKALAAHCHEGEKRIAAALRELEALGYLQRVRERLPGGEVITRTVFCNQPTALLHPRSPATDPGPAPRQAQAPAPVPPQAQTPASAPAPAARPERLMPPATSDQSEQTDPPAPETPAPLPLPPPSPFATPPAPLFVPLVPPPTAPKPPPRPLPRPTELTPELDRAATALLSDLPTHATPQFTLSEDDVRRLVPGVAAWLERAARPDAIRHALTDDPPHPLKHPAKLLKYRLTELLPPPPPGIHDLAALARPLIRVTPFQTCDDCDRAFRSPTPGHCRDCREHRTHHTNREQQAPRSEGVRTAA